jgi:hypothetical protein
VVRSLLLALGLALVAAPAPSCDGTEVDALRALEAFLALEFEGVQDARYTHALMSDAMPDGYPDAHVLDPDAIELDIVDGFNVATAQRENERICAIVEFVVVARARGTGAWDRRIEQHSAIDRETYCMVETGSGWRPLDPGLPRVSAEAVRRFMGERAALVDEVSAREPISPSQARYRASLSRQIREIEAAYSERIHPPVGETPTPPIP